MPLEDRNPKSYGPVAPPNPEPAPKRKRLRRTCPKVTPYNPPRWVSKKETVGGRCNYIPSDGNLCPHWRAKDSYACPCHVEAYESPDAAREATSERKSAGPRKAKRRIAVMLEPNTMWRENEPL